MCPLSDPTTLLPPLLPPRQWFIYKFDRQQAGLMGLSFDEGEFGVVGYAVKVRTKGDPN